VIYEFTVEHRLRRTILKVSRITEKQIVIGENAYERRFAKKNCREIGNDGKLIEPTPELLNEAREKIERRRLIIFLQKIKLSDLSMSSLYKMKQIIEEDAK
jgi:hypothetical protein